MQLHILSASLLLALAAQPSPAQRVWIVDNVNPVGAHFNDLPVAVASPLVGHGDVIVLRLGNGRYTGGSFSKGVSIVAPAVVTIGFPGGQAMAVSQLPAGTHFALRNVRLEGLPSRTAIDLSGCVGSVHLDGVTIVSAGAPVQNPGNAAGLRCNGCSAVTVQGCRIEGKPAIAASGSSIAVTSSTLVGTDGAIGDNIAVPAGVGLDATSSNVAIAYTMVSGGSGASSTFWNLSTPGVPALVASGGSLLIGGRAPVTSFIAGAPAGSEAIAAVVCFGLAAGAAAIDPRVLVLPSGGSPPIQGAPANAVRTVAALGAQRTSAFALSFSVLRRQSDVVALIGGLRAPPVNGPLGRIWLDLGLSVWLAGSVIDNSEQSTHLVSVPNLPILLGMAIGFQAAVLSGTTLEVTNPAVFVLGV